MAAVVDFLVNLSVFSLPLELGFQIVVAVPILVVAVADKKAEYRSVKVLCERVLTVIGVALLALATRQVYLDRHRLDAREVVLDFALPGWLTVGWCRSSTSSASMSPTMRSFTASAGKTLADGHAADPGWPCYLSCTSVWALSERLAGYWHFTRKLGEAQTFSGARRVVAEFLDTFSREEQAKTLQRLPGAR